jgi:hypothetical protein
MPTTPEDRGELLTAVNRLAPLLRHQGQLGEAEQLLDQTQRSLQSTWPADVRHPTLRPMVHSFYANRAETQVQLGKHAEAARTAAELPPLEPDAWQAARRAAGFLARCVPLAEQDQQLSPKQRQELAQTYADQASALLREAIRRGLPGIDRLREAPDLAPLRSRPDFPSRGTKSESPSAGHPYRLAAVGSGTFPEQALHFLVTETRGERAIVIPSPLGVRAGTEDPGGEDAREAGMSALELECQHSARVEALLQEQA